MTFLDSNFCISLGKFELKHPNQRENGGKLIKYIISIERRIGLGQRRSREEQALFAKLKDVIFRKLNEIDSDSDEDDDDSEVEGYNSDELNDELNISIDSSDLDSMDSSSDSETFQEMLSLINGKFKMRINKLMKYFQSKIEDEESQESENESFLNSIKEESTPEKCHIKASKLSKYLTNNKKEIKQEMETPVVRKRDKKAEIKESLVEPKPAGPMTLNQILDSFYYTNYGDVRSESCSSSRSVPSIKQERNSNPNSKPTSPKQAQVQKGLTSLELFLKNFKHL